MKLILLLAIIFTTETLGQVSDGQPASAAIVNAAFMGRLGNTSTIGNITVNSEKEVRFEDSGSNFMGFKAPSTVTSSTTFTWPDGDGAGSNYVMVTDGAGTLSWVERFTRFLTDGQIFVGNVSDVPTGVTPSGELTMSNAGAFVLDNNSVIAKSLTGFSSGAGTITSADTLLSSIEKLDGNIDLKLDETLNDTNIFVGNGSNVAIGVAMSSEATIDNVGAMTLNNDSVIGKLLTGFTPGAGTVAATDTILEAIQKLDANDVSALSAALTSGNIFVGNGSNLATGVSMSGEASIDNAGAVTLLNSAVIGKVITGFVSGAGTVAAADTLLEAIEKLNGNIALLAAPGAESLIMQGGAGFGSTATMIREFATTVEDNTGTLISFTNDATNSFVLTAEDTCLLTVSYSEFDGTVNVDVQVGLSLNNTQVTTAVGSITNADRVAFAQPLRNGSGAAGGGHVSWTGIVTVGDDIRPHTNGNWDGAAAQIHFSATCIAVTAL